MDRERFVTLLAAYGADFSRWPAEESAAGAAFAAEHAADVEALLVEARDLDAELNAARADRFNTASLASRILAAAPRPVRAVFDRRAAIALAACAVFGVVLGYGGGQFAPLPAVEDDSYFTSAFEAPFIGAGDEG